MSEVILIVGLPGSGKSCLAREIQTERGTDWKIFDDPDQRSQAHITDHIRAGGNCIITDPHFCRESSLRLAQAYFEAAGAVQIECVYFQNNEEACKSNIERRSDGRSVSITLHQLAQIYNPPAHALPVWTPENILPIK